MSRLRKLTGLQRSSTAVTIMSVQSSNQLKRLKSPKQLTILRRRLTPRANSRRNSTAKRQWPRLASQSGPLLRSEFTGQAGAAYRELRYDFRQRHSLPNARSIVIHRRCVAARRAGTFLFNGPAMSTTAVDRLMQLGRWQGGLEIEDIRQALPIDTMTIEELTDVVARLEEAGISVEIDADLLTAHHRKIALPEVRSTPEPSQQDGRTTPAHPSLLSLATAIKTTKESSSRTSGSTRPYVQKSDTVFILAAALILILIAWGVWRFA